MRKLLEKILEGGWVNPMSGGLADNRTPDEFDPEQLAMGIEVEMEHTGDKTLATKIAMDHLVEFPNYYTALAKMEKSLEAQKNGNARTESDRDSQ